MANIDFSAEIQYPNIVQLLISDTDITQYRYMQVFTPNLFDDNITNCWIGPLCLIL